MADILQFVIGLSDNNFDPSAAAGVLESVIGDAPMEAIEKAIGKLDSIGILASTFHLAENTATLQNFVFALLMKYARIDEKHLGTVLDFLSKEREGSVGRHFLMIQFFSLLTFKQNGAFFGRCTNALLQVLEIVFSEIFQNDMHKAAIHSAEEMKLLGTDGVGCLKKCALTFIKNNHQILNEPADVIDICDYVEITEQFEHRILGHPSADQLNKAAFIRFLGNLIAKVDFAKFFADKQHMTAVSHALGEMESLLKPFNAKISANCMAIMEAEANLIRYRKYRELCMEGPAEHKSLINLHAAIYLSPDKELEVWSGYGINLAIYLFRSQLLVNLYPALSLNKLLQYVSSFFSMIPQDYAGGLDYYHRILGFILEKLKKSNFKVTNPNDGNLFLQDFLISLHSLDINSNKETSILLQNWVEFILLAVDGNTRFTMLLRALDFYCKPEHLSSSPNFVLGLATVYLGEIRKALNEDIQISHQFLKIPPLGRLLHALASSDHRQLGRLRRSRF